MADLIDRRAVLALPRNGIRNMRGEIVEETINVAYIEQLPSVDAVQVIRCKDCKYNSNPPEFGNAVCDTFDGMTDQMGYCHYGERREE